MRRNIVLFKWIAFFRYFWPLSTLSAVYVYTIVHTWTLTLSLFALVTLFGVIMEIPTGILSDKLGRKNNLILSAFFQCINYFLFALAGSLQLPILLFFAAFCEGTAEAFYSGTDTAFMFETTEALNEKGNYDLLYSKTRMYTQIGLVCSALVAIAITVFFSLNVLAWVSVIPIVILLFLTLFLKNIHTSPKEYIGISSYSHFKRAFVRILRNKNIRFWGLFGGSFEATLITMLHMDNAYFTTLLSNAFINTARLVRNMLGALGYYILPKFRQHTMPKVYFFSVAGIIVVRGIGVCLNIAISPFIMATEHLFHSGFSTANSSILQHQYSPHERATMESILSLFTNAMSAVLFVIFGYLADLFSPRFVILLVFALHIVLWLYSICYYKKHLAESAQPKTTTI